MKKEKRLDKVSESTRIKNEDSLENINEKVLQVFRKISPDGYAQWTYSLLERTIKDKFSITVSSTLIRHILIDEIGAAHVYRIAGHSFQISIDATDDVFLRLSHYQLFNDTTKRSNKSLFHLHITKLSKEFLNNTKSIALAQKKGKGNMWYLNDDKLCFVYPKMDGTPSMVLSIGKDFCNGTLAVEKNANPELLLQSIVRMYSMRTNALKTLILHAVVVEYKGLGYIFIGNCRTGKTTHSHLWVDNIPGAKYFNDDRPVIRIHPDGSAWVYGTPWAGDSPVYRNEKLPIGGIVQLAQAPFNKIRSVPKLEAYTNLLPRIQNALIVEQADSLKRTIIELISAVPSWHLDCLPNKEAAILCCNTIVKR